MIDNKKWNKMTDDEKIGYMEGLFEDSKKSLVKNHFEWYMNYMFIDGNHYASYNSVSNALETPPRKEGEVRMVVNKVKSNIRAVKNYLNKAELKWEVMPGDLDEETITNARRSGKFLDYLYRHLHLEGMISGMTDYVLNTSIAWTELDWDDKAENGLGQVRVKVHDSFDVYPDPRGYIYAGRYKGVFLAKALKKPLEEIMSDERYDKKKRKGVKPDDKMSESEMKTRLMMKQSGSLDQEKTKRVTVKEFLLYSYDTNGKGGNLKLCTYAGGKLLREEDLKNKEYTLYPMQVDMKPNKVIQRSWTADAIPLNKALDRAFSQKIMYNNQALIYRIIAEKGHGVNEITNEMGVVYEINKNRKWEQMQMSSYPSSGDSLIDQSINFIEDTLGAHEASMGSLPAGARSGKTLEALQAADSINLNGILQSLNSFLSVLGTEILNIVADKYVASRIIKLTDAEGDQQFDKVVGQEANAGKEGSTIITKDNEVIVKIGSWLGHTLEAQRDTLLKLAEIGAIPTEEVLKHFEFTNIGELSEKAKEQRMEQHQLDAEIAGRQQEQQEPAPDPMIDLADKEMMEMANGQVLPPTEGASIQHTQAHVDFTKTDTFAGLPQQVQQAIAQHFQGEAKVNGLMS